MGVPVIDTDVIAHQVVEPGQPALVAIASEFGQAILEKDGKLNRRLLREKIFSDPLAKQALEAILHPAIRSRALEEITSVQAPYCLVVIPLFTETGAYDWVDRVLVVDTTEETQIQRVMQRDGVDRQHAEAALASQASREARLALADDVIENNGAVVDLDAAVEKLHIQYIKFAQDAQRRTH